LLGLIACHVVGNSLGTRLRDQVSDHLREHPAAGRTRPSPADIPRAPATRLGRKTRVVGWPLLVVSTAGGVTAAVIGGREFAAAAWREIPLREWLLACGSFAVLGGFLAFMAASFLGVLLQALVEAHVYRGPVVSPSKKPAGLIDEAAVVAGPSNRGRP